MGKLRKLRSRMKETLRPLLDDSFRPNGKICDSHYSCAAGVAHVYVYCQCDFLHGGTLTGDRLNFIPSIQSR